MQAHRPFRKVLKCSLHTTQIAERPASAKYAARSVAEQEKEEAAKWSWRHLFGASPRLARRLERWKQTPHVWQDTETYEKDYPKEWQQFPTLITQGKQVLGVQNLFPPEADVTMRYIKNLSERRIEAGRMLVQMEQDPERFVWHGLRPGDWVESRGNRNYTELIFLRASTTNPDHGVFLSRTGQGAIAHHSSIVFTLGNVLDSQKALLLAVGYRDTSPNVVMTQTYAASGMHENLGVLSTAIDSWDPEEIEHRLYAVKLMRRLTMFIEKLERSVRQVQLTEKLAAATERRRDSDKDAPFTPLLLDTAVTNLLHLWKARVKIRGQEIQTWHEDWPRVRVKTRQQREEPYEDELDQLLMQGPWCEDEDQLDSLFLKQPDRDLKMLELVTQRALLDDPLRFVPDGDNIRFTRRFLKRPHWQIEHLQSFARAAESPEQIAHMGGLIRDSDANITGQFARHLTTFLGNYGDQQQDICSSDVSAILKRAVPPDSAGGDLTSQVLAFLRDAGTIKEGENLVRLDHRSPLATWADPVPMAADNPQVSLMVQDPLEKLRVDIQQPVYVIDAPGAHELDDGICVTRDDDHDTFWVHVNIADPAAVLPKDHQESAKAQWRMQSIYFDGRVKSMLHDAFRSEDNSGDRLGVNLGEISPQRTLMFSARFDKDLNMLEEKVQPGRAHKVIRTTYQHVDALLRDEEPPKLEMSRPIQLMPKSAKSELELLGKVAAHLFAERVEHGMLISQPPIVNLPNAPPDEEEPSLSFPDEAEFSGASTINAELIVQEMMIMANRIAGRYCAAKGLPVLYRQIEAPLPGTDAANAIEELRKIRNPKTGEVPWSDAIAARHLHRPASYSTRPGPHLGIGIVDAAREGGYLQVTSPLRRYSDLLAHWQLHSSFLEQPLAFSKELVDIICQHFNAALPDRRDITRRLNAHHKLLELQEHVGVDKPVQSAVITHDAHWSRFEGCVTMPVMLPQLRNARAQVRVFGKNVDVPALCDRLKAGTAVDVRLEKMVLDMQPSLHAIMA